MRHAWSPIITRSPDVARASRVSYGLLCPLERDAGYYLAASAVIGFSIVVNVVRAVSLYYPATGHSSRCFQLF